MNETTMTFADWMRALESLMRSKAVTALAVRPSPTWEAYHELGLTPEKAFATVLHDEVQTWGVRIEIAGFSERPSVEDGQPTMAFAEWMAALDNLTKGIASVRITLASSHIWLVDHQKGLTPEQSFHEVVGQVIEDIGVRLDLADRADAAEDRPL